MIEEGYVNYDVARLLKDKGFDEKCFVHYADDGRYMVHTESPYYNSILPNQKECTIPTQALVLKWLRDKHKIVCNICIESRNFYYYSIFLIRSGVEAQFQSVSPKPYYETYESACNAAIKYCLEKFV